jgi:hypothetical protein
MKFLILLATCILAIFQSAEAGVSDAQRRVIDNQIFLLKEGMVSEKEVFKKAKKFDDKGVFGIGSDEMTRDEYKEYLREKSFTILD